MDGWVILLAGSLAGLLNGWLGLGGMSIFIPTLIVAFSGQASGADLMLMVLANAFVVSLINSLVAWAQYHKHQVVNYSALKYSQPSAVLGAMVAFAAVISFHWIAAADRFFGAYLIIMAVLVWWLDKRSDDRDDREISRAKQVGFGFAGGVASGLIGFNGNSFFTPALRKAGLNIKTSVATAQVLGASIAATAALTILAYSLIVGVEVFVFKWIVALAVSSSFFSVVGARIKRRMAEQRISWAVSTAYAVTGVVLVSGVLHQTSPAVAAVPPSPVSAAQALQQIRTVERQIGPPPSTEFKPNCQRPVAAAEKAACRGKRRAG